MKAHNRSGFFKILLLYPETAPNVKTFQQFSF